MDYVCFIYLFKKKKSIFMAVVSDRQYNYFLTKLCCYKYNLMDYTF